MNWKQKLTTKEQVQEMLNNAENITPLEVNIKRGITCNKVRVWRG